ncbi:hypothetical protein HOP50_05g38750 [Chloropicon primus]|uniref:Uncharacterized protein n=1 Tax=Chloropicon primus TaxID=1764295 RepID=A0A5B8MMS0_9CHLO|nr:hypothetical protein A3770_05p38620 [Chloropicon primus]UPR00560.1 hypothetical protein HOP50_05g38750 [Chloropicon primus]|eukprot:QDZ21344.1 hypothetical protein A3770_05p38620 [Chloropicon primus]
MLPVHSKGNKWVNGKGSGLAKRLQGVSGSTLILLLLMTSVNLFLFAYSSGFGGSRVHPLGGSEGMKAKTTKERASRGQSSHAVSHSYFSKEHFSHRQDVSAPHAELIRSNVVVATYASEAYLYHVKTLVGSVQYWQQDFQVNVYYKSASKNWKLKLEAIKSLRAVSIDEAVEDILAMRNEDDGKCSSLLRSIGKNLDEIGSVVQQDLGVFQPIVTLHAFCTSGESLGTLYLEPWMFFNGWIDIAVRSLQYDKHLVPCTDPADKRNACLKGVQGYGSEIMIEDLLLPQLGCTVIGTCSFLDKAGNKNGGFQTGTQFGEGGGSWWTQKAPQYLVDAVGGKCLNSSNVMIASHQKVGFEDGQLGEEDGATCVVGETSQPYQCHLRYNPVVEYTHFADSKQSRRRGKGKPIVALGFVVHTPVTSLLNNAANMALLESPLLSLQEQLKSSAESIHVYVAFESSGTEETDTQASKQIRYQLDLNLGLQEVEIFSVGNTDSISAAANFLFGQAMEDGHDYFMAFGDGTKLVTPMHGVGDKSWLSMLVSSFSATPVLPNFGVVAPIDPSNPKGITCPLVHRTHHEIFGELYPSHLTYYESQVWISLVYGYQYTYLMTSVEMDTEMQRAAACMNDHLLQETVQSGKRAITSWAQGLGGLTLDHIASSLSVQEL